MAAAKGFLPCSEGLDRANDKRDTYVSDLGIILKKAQRMQYSWLARFHKKIIVF